MKSRSFVASFIGIGAPAPTNTEFSVAHALGGEDKPTAPRGWMVIRRNAAATLYESGTTWTTTTAYFKCDTALARFTVLFFI